VLGVHALEEVDALRVVRHAANHAVHGRDPVRKPGPDGERVRSPARAARDREPFDAERIGERLDVAHDVADLPAVVRVRASVPRTVVRHQADARGLHPILFRWTVEPAAGRAVQGDDRYSVRVAPLLVYELTAVVRTDARHVGAPLVRSGPSGDVI